MNKKAKITISIVIITITFLTLLGLTYAYYRTRIIENKNTNSISVTSTKLELKYEDGNGILTINNIEPSNNYVTFKDSNGNSIESKIFTVTNTGNEIIKGYNVVLENIQNQFSRKEDIIYKLTCTSYKNYETTEQIESGNCSGTDETTFPEIITSIVTNDIEPETTHKYELKVKYKEMGVDQSIDMDKTISAKINIYDGNTKFLANEIIKNAKSTESVNYNKTIYIDSNLQDGNSYTIPLEQPNKPSERVLSYDIDDKGISYYYRGNVEDNYVNFAGMCWRIVRITGDGNIKIILEDQNELCSSSMDKNWDIPTETNGTLKKGNFGYENLDIYYEYRGHYSYLGTKKIMNYLNPSAESKPTSMSTAFQNFQTGELVDYLDKLTTENWCIANNAYEEKGTYPNYTYSLLTETEKKSVYKYHNYDIGDVLDEDEDNFWGDEYMYYDSYIMTNPTFQCNGTTMNKFYDNTDMFVGTLSASEIIYAGAGKYESEKNYLSSNKSWFTLSPSHFSNSAGEDHIYSNDGFEWLFPWSSVNDTNSFRPAVSLISNVSITKGIGTIDKPYVID